MMSDELSVRGDSTGEPTLHDPRWTELVESEMIDAPAPFSGSDTPPTLDTSVITPLDPGMEIDDDPKPLPGFDPSHIGEMVPGTVFPTPVVAGGSGGGTTTGGSGGGATIGAGSGATVITLRYASKLTVQPLPAPKHSCSGDYVTFTAKNGSLKVIICNGYINGKENIVWPVQDSDPQTPVTYESVALGKPFKYPGCFTHWHADGLAGVTTYSVVGRLDGKDFSNQ